MTAPSPLDVITQHVTADSDPVQVLTALTDAGYQIVKTTDLATDLAAMAAWQKSALIVITAANKFVADVVTGDGNPTTIARALIDSGFDGRTQ